MNVDNLLPYHYEEYADNVELQNSYIKELKSRGEDNEDVFTTRKHHESDFMGVLEIYSKTK